MNISPPFQEYQDSIQKTLAQKALDVSALDQLQRELETEIFGWPPEPSHDKVKLAGEARVSALLDVLDVLARLEPDESAHPWKRAGILSAIGRHLESARDYFSAYERFVVEAEQGTGITGDEEDWATSALSHGAEEFARGGELMTAAFLAIRLPEDERREAISLIRQRLSS